MRHALPGCTHQFSCSLSASEPWQFQYCQCELDLRFITPVLWLYSAPEHCSLAHIHSPVCSQQWLLRCKSCGMFAPPLGGWSDRTVGAHAVLNKFNKINNLQTLRYSSLKPSEAHEFVNLAWQQLVWSRLFPSVNVSIEWETNALRTCLLYDVCHLFSILFLSLLSNVQTFLCRFKYSLALQCFKFCICKIKVMNLKMMTL